MSKRTILITGSSRGIGRAVARLAYKQGYRVILHGRTDSRELNEIYKELKGSIKVYFDVADKKETNDAISNLISKVNKIDVLVNDAGIAKNFIKGIEEVDDEKALDEYRVNVLGIIHCVQAVLPKMLEQGNGSVINLSSIKGYPNLSTMSTLTYAVSKAGVISLTKSLAKIYSPRGIRFNVIAPGYTKTDQVKDWTEETFKRINEGTLLSRMAKPEEIAPLVMFLASNESSYITGADILIDGGYSIKGK